MDPRQACLDCLAQEPPALFEAALWIAAEHLPAYSPAHALRELDELVRQIGASLDDRASASERAQGLLRRMSEQGFCEDDDFPATALGPASAGAAAAPGTAVVAGAGGHGTGAAAGHSAGRSELPGRFLLRVPQADHLLDPATGRRLYPTDCRELLLHHAGAEERAASRLPEAGLSGEILQRLSRNLRQLHSAAGEPLAALKDAQRVIELGPVGAADHEARAGLYRQLDCPQAERYDLERALLLSDDPTEQLRLGQRLGELAPPTGRALH